MPEEGKNREEPITKTLLKNFREILRAGTKKQTSLDEFIDSIETIWESFGPMMEAWSALGLGAIVAGALAGGPFGAVAGTAILFLPVAICVVATVCAFTSYTYSVLANTGSHNKDKENDKSDKGSSKERVNSIEHTKNKEHDRDRSSENRQEIAKISKQENKKHRDSHRHKKPRIRKEDYDVLQTFAAHATTNPQNEQPRKRSRDSDERNIDTSPEQKPVTQTLSAFSTPPLQQTPTYENNPFRLNNFATQVLSPGQAASETPGIQRQTNDVQKLNPFGSAPFTFDNSAFKPTPPSQESRGKTPIKVDTTRHTPVRRGRAGGSGREHRNP